MLRTRERTELQQLARRELPGLYALARHLAGDDAEDLVQETLVRACRSFGSLRDPRAGGRWLRVILTNLWRDRVRRDQRSVDEVPIGDDEHFSLFRRLAEEDPFPYSDTLHVDLLGAFSEADVRTVLDRLPARYRVPLVLRYVEGFPATDVAEMLGEPRGTIFSLLHRGRARFEREMWHYAEESGMLGPGIDGSLAQDRNRR